jgi:hypothetical protein
MTLAEAIAQWLEALARDDSVSQSSAESRALSLSWLARYAGDSLALDDLTPARLRDFLSRWYIENSGTSTPGASSAASMTTLPDAATLIDSLTAFIDWATLSAGFTAAPDCLEVVAELRDRLPRSQAISSSLAQQLAARGGAFGFPEFLTSFEAGGHSQYDLDTPGEPGCMEGYFRIRRVDGCRVEVEEVLTEAMAWPVHFPAQVAALLEADYLLDLQLVRVEEGWQVVACGFAYPPGTEL